MSGNNNRGISLPFSPENIFQRGTEIKIYFTTGFVETGVVEYWGDTIILENESGISLINNGPLIMMVRVLKKIPTVEDIVDESGYDEDAHIKNIESVAELRRRKAQAEREMFRNRLGEMSLSKSYTGSIGYGDQLSILGEKPVSISPSKKNRQRNK